MSIEPDTKDWTWVLGRECPECAFDARAVEAAEIPHLIEVNTRGWSVALGRPHAAVRVRPDVWSTVEYACHVRDVHALFDQRVAAMLVEDDPCFADWDQDVAALQQRYAEQEPIDVEIGLIEAAGSVAGRYALVSGQQWERTARRSNGATFTVQSMGRYHLHDIVHHLHDVDG